MHRNELKVKIMSVENVRKMQKIYLYDTVDGIKQTAVFDILAYWQVCVISLCPLQTILTLA